MKQEQIKEDFGNQETGLLKPDSLIFNSKITLKNTEVISATNLIRNLELKLKNTENELTLQKELTTELQNRFLNENQKEHSENLQNSFSQSEEFKETTDYNSPFLKNMVDNLNQKIKLRKTIVSPFEKQSISSRGRSTHMTANRTKKINILGGEPLNSINVLHNYDEHYGICSELRDSIINKQDRVARQTDFENKMSVLEVW